MDMNEKWIHLCGMPLNVSMLEFTKFLQDRTQGIRKTLMVHSSRGTFKGYAFVKYERPYQAQSAAEVLNGVILKGRRLHVSQCRDIYPTIQVQVRDLHIAEQQRWPRQSDRYWPRNRREDSEDRRWPCRIRPARKVNYGKRRKQTELEEVLDFLRNPDRLKNGSLTDLSDRTEIPSMEKKNETGTRVDSIQI